MGESEDTKRTISLQDLAARFLMFIVFLKVFLPHLEAICCTIRDQSWKPAGPTVVDAASVDVADAA